MCPEGDFAPTFLGLFLAHRQVRILALGGCTTWSQNSFALLPLWDSEQSVFNGVFTQHAKVTSCHIALMLWQEINTNVTLTP